MSQAPTVFQRRIVIGAVLCAAAFALVGIRLVHVTLLKSLTDGRAPVTFVARADLTDRNGELLARDLPVKDLYARPHVFWNIRESAHDLAQATGTDERRLLQGFSNTKHPYVLVARQITPDTEARVMHLGLPGLEFEPGAKRYYPDGRMAAQLVGVTDPDNNGLSGLELGLQNQIRAAAGGQVRTSVDMRVQYILAHEVEMARQTFTAKAAGGIVMDVKTGEVLAMVSAPDFDPNLRKVGDGDSTRNIMAQDIYELGSVFKIFSFAMALEDHTLKSLDEIFTIGQGMKLGKFTIHEAEHMPATLAARDILAQSSNIGTAQIVLRSGPARQRQFLTTMGLLKPIATELPETARPLFPGNNWGQIETATVGFGQGISVSPLSFIAAAASVVNGGRRIVPTFLKQDASDLRGEQVIKPETSEQMRDLLRYVVTNGSGKRADVPGYDVGGKTGSAQVPGPHGRYIPHALRTSFFGVFPVHNPRYVVFLILDQPHGTKQTAGFALAGWTAAPAVARVIQRIAPLLNVPNDAPPTKLAQAADLMTPHSDSKIAGMKDFNGLNLTGLASDSRKVKPGYLFAALSGTKTDGASFLKDAVERGAIAVLGAPALAGDVAALGVRFIPDDNPRAGLARYAAAFYSAQPEIVAAVTGTKGKSSVVAFLREIWTALGKPAASLGTVGVIGPNGTMPLSHTTPDPVEIHRLLAQLKQGGVEHLAIEASSHGLDQHRLDGVAISGCGFTNITRDHMDYHVTFDDYLTAKLRLFSQVVRDGGVAVVNADADHAGRFADAAKARGLKLITVGEKGDTVTLVAREERGDAQHLTIAYTGKTHEVLLPLAGTFQASNALVAAGLAIGLGEDAAKVFQALKSLKGAPGRMEKVAFSKDAAPIYVDYAHTPDSLEKVLEALRPHTENRLYVVFGCGGDRDKGKRPLMGAVAMKLANAVIVTDDNPRSEDPAAIRAEILVAALGAREIADRAEAIRAAIAELKPGDVLVIAGKGHETGQYIKDDVHPFSDRGQAVEAAIALGGRAA